MYSGGGVRRGRRLIKMEGGRRRKRNVDACVTASARACVCDKGGEKVVFYISSCHTADARVPETVAMLPPTTTTSSSSSLCETEKKSIS